MVALKKIFGAFNNATGSSNYFFCLISTNPFFKYLNYTDAQRTFREIQFLQELGDHGNVVRLLKVMKADNDVDIYLVFEFMGTYIVLLCNVLFELFNKRSKIV